VLHGRARRVHRRGGARGRGRPRPEASRGVSYAVLSCDLDTVDRHLQGYGFDDLPPCDLIYRTALPRLLELFDQLGVPGVLFMIGRDAEAQRDLLRSAVAAGHEVARHSLPPPPPFSALGGAGLRREVRRSAPGPSAARRRGWGATGSAFGRRGGTSTAACSAWCARPGTATTPRSSRLL